MAVASLTPADLRRFEQAWLRPDKAKIFVVSDRPLAEVRRLSGWLADRDGTVWLERGCPEHGLVSTLYDESADLLRYLEPFFRPEVVKG